MRAVITGASGFIGRTLTAGLVERGHHVVALTRQPDLPAATTVVVWRDLVDRDALARACEGAGALVHVASRVHVMHAHSSADAAAFHRINVDGSAIVAEVAAAAGIRHLIYLSTVKVHGEGRATAYTEADPVHPMDAYAASKSDAERMLDAAASSAFGVTVLRPPLVYGPHVRANFRRLLRAANLARHVPLPLGGIDNRRSMLFVDNLVDAVARTLDHPPPRRSTYLLSDGEDLSTSDLVRILSLHLGGHARLFAAPRVTGLLAGLIGRRDELRRLFGALTVDASKFRRAMGWMPPYRTDAGLRRTAHWWAQGGGTT